VEPLEVCISRACTFNPFNVVEIMTKIRIYIEGNEEFYLLGEAETFIESEDNSLCLRLKQEDMEELICKMEDLCAEVMYGSPDE
jgi:hypothetical protein